MSERYTPAEAYGLKLETRVEVDPLLETQEKLSKIDKLMFELIEKAGDLNPLRKKQLRTMLDDLLQSLGLKNMKELTEFRGRFVEQINNRRKDPKTPQDYPSESEFSYLMKHAVGQNKPSTWFVPPQIRADATGVAEYGHSEWSQLQRRNSDSLVEYQYKLGRVLADRVAYGDSIEEIDPIEISPNWEVANGRHRGLALVTLGAGFIRRHGLDGWVKVGLEHQ